MEATYWGNNGTHQALVEKLNALIPASGSVARPAKNKNLEKFRKASNAYYDIFNNGGMNRGISIAKIFGINVRHYRYGNSTDWNRIHTKVEPIMDQIIQAAAWEQGIDQ